MPFPRTAGPLSPYTDLIDLASRIPLALPQLATRFAVGLVFWNSAQTKLANWPVTVQLFVFPGHWTEHLLWSSGLLLLVVRGAGFFSLDHMASRWFRG